MINDHVSFPSHEPENKGISRREFLKRAGYTSVAAIGAGGVASTLASCGGFAGGSGSSSSSSSGALSFWQFYGPNGGASNLQSQWVINLANAWNKSNKTQITLQYIPNSDYQNGSKLPTAFASGQGPDIFVISPGDFLRYYNGGVLKDLTPYIDKAAQNDLYPDVMRTRLVDGKIYAIPMEVAPMAMYYSVDAFNQAGLSEKDIPQTWDQLLALAAKLKTNKRYGMAFETTPGYYQNFTWYPFMWQTGADAVDSATGKSGFNSNGVVQALSLWKNAVQEGLAPRTVLGGGGGDIVANLASGYCAMQNVGIWGVSALNQNAPKFKYGVFKLPLPPGGTYKTVLGGWALVANAKGKNQEEAAKFCAWAMASTSADSVKRGTDWIVETSNLGPRKSVMAEATKEGAFSQATMQYFEKEVFPGGRGEPRYPPEVYKAISDALQACMLSNADPQQQAANASKIIDTFLSSYKGASIL